MNVEDTYGNIVTTSGTTVTLTPSVGSFSGSVPPTTSGVATFSVLSTTTAGSYTVTASSTGLTSAVSSSFTVNPAAPSKVIFTTAPPTTGTAGSNLTSFAVSVEDTYGNVETGSNTGNADVINLTVATGPGSIASGASATASGGVATFSSTVLNTAGSYTLTATDGTRSITTATSSPATVISPAAGATLSITTSPVSG